ncbi:MAG: glucose-6-phosphate dehydrogenase [Candidatus Izemoplasmatales bacterium]|nr:glucose-6-phosphate dehydrogenase [Candidatus Izemoplasmatales bacterium]
MKTVLTIFGATGNLMHKKLALALIQLLKQKQIDDSFQIICVSRRDYTTEMYFEHLKEFVKSDIDLDVLKNNLEYVKMDIMDLNDYTMLRKKIESKSSFPYQSLFYLAVAPEFFVDIASGISNAKLIEKGNSIGRIVFEKPFGVSFGSAKEINQKLSEYFEENQIFRIDHYLGKDMIQNILVMRFANRLLENNWSSDSISQVSIDVKETEGIGNRGEYYDSSGALKDMIQSHLLQMLALVAMEEPKSLSSDDIRKEKIKVLQNTIVKTQNAVFGQYEGYLFEQKIPQDSITETFVFLKAEVSTPRWKNVPFFLTTGKKLNEKKAEIIIDFKEHSSAKKLWPNNNHTSNQLVIGISEYEGIRFQMNVKKPGLNDTVSDALLDYCHSCQKIGNNPEAYEKLLKDFIVNNSTLFTSWKEIEASWNIIDHLKKDLSNPVIYKSISDFADIISKVKRGV